MADDEENDPTAPFNELEAFDSIFQALKWKQIKTRLPICSSKTFQNRYFFANFVYLCYAVGILVIDFHPDLSGGFLGCFCPRDNETYDDYYYNYAGEQEQAGFTLLNRIYIGFAVIHMISATLYWWAWKDHRWNDVIMIPEYLNHIEAALYLWSAIWYSREDGYYGYYTTTLHQLETVAAFVELFASFGWIMSWYRTYTRTIGRGYTFDDPDTVAYILTTLSSFIYITYNIQILLRPEDYGANQLYFYGDIIYSVGAVFYLLANLRDDGWLWWIPVAGQYGIAAGRIETGKAIKFGLPHLLIGGNEPCTRCCRQRRPLTNGGNNGRVSVISTDEKKEYTNNDMPKYDDNVF